MTYIQDFVAAVPAANRQALSITRIGPRTPSITAAAITGAGGNDTVPLLE